MFSDRGHRWVREGRRVMKSVVVTVPVLVLSLSAAAICFFFLLLFSLSSCNCPPPPPCAATSLRGPGVGSYGKGDQISPTAEDIAWVRDQIRINGLQMHDNVLRKGINPRTRAQQLQDLIQYSLSTL